MIIIKKEFGFDVIYKNFKIKTLGDICHMAKKGGKLKRDSEEILM